MNKPWRIASNDGTLVVAKHEAGNIIELRRQEQSQEIWLALFPVNETYSNAEFKEKCSSLLPSKVHTTEWLRDYARSLYLKYSTHEGLAAEYAEALGNDTLLQLFVEKFSDPLWYWDDDITIAAKKFLAEQETND